MIAPRPGQYTGVSVIIAPSAPVEAWPTAATQKAARSSGFDDTARQAAKLSRQTAAQLS